MARLITIEFPAPWHNLEFMELDQSEVIKGNVVTRSNLYLVDPKEPHGLHLLQSKRKHAIPLIAAAGYEKD